MRYIDVPLHVVLTDFRPFASRQIKADPRIAKVPVLVIVDRRDADEWIRELPEWLPVAVDESDPHYFSIRCLSRSCAELDGYY